MKRFSLIIAIVSLIVLCSCGIKETSTKNKTDFRNSSWGDSMNTVLTSDKADLQINSPQSLYGKDKLLNDEECEILYTFNESDQLVKGEYTVKHFNKSVDESYSDYVDFLKNKYGEPTDSDDFEHIHYSYFETPRTKIKLEVIDYEMTIKYEPLIEVQEKNPGMGGDGL